MSLGCFSASLTGADLDASRTFYENLGFSVFHGDPDQGFLIMKNGTCNIGLFQGMFERNMLTFNPGWDESAAPVSDFEDVRAIQARLTEAGVTLAATTDPDGTGPASIMVTDPDGNPILIDQHVDRPG